ncbi:MAG: hypothetical protein SFZ03_05935 [Candidatus Melainabacteria bacterium]|nr:hypothetical protein [Candidatus Melainabacteria bacterium]
MRKRPISFSNPSFGGHCLLCVLKRVGLKGMLATVLLTATLLWGLWQAAPSVADTVHLRGGKVLTGRLREVVGDIVMIKTRRTGIHQVSRMELENRLDILELHGLPVKHQTNVVVGEIKYITPFRYDILTRDGLIRLPAWRVFKAHLGKARHWQDTECLKATTATPQAIQTP